MRKIGLYVLLGFLAVLLASLGLLRHNRGHGPHSVTLTWHAPRTKPGVRLVGYNVYRRTSEETTYVRLAERVTGTSYEDPLVTSGRNYVYVVTSVDDRGHESRFSVAATAAIP